MAKEITDKFDVECNLYQSAEDVPDLRELISEKKNLMVFDDLLLEKQNTCESYYVTGRHSKTYYSSPNIDRSNNCFSSSPDANAPWFDIIIP